MEEGRSGEDAREWGREEMQGCGGCLVEQHRRPPPPLVGEQWRRPRGLAGGEPSAAAVSVAPKDENGTEISRTEPHLFLYLIRSNSYFRTNSNSVQNSEHQIQNRNENGLDIFSTIFYFSTFNSEYPEFEIRFKPNLAH